MTRAQILALLRDLCRRGTGLLVVTHDVEVALAADRVAVLAHGRISETAPRADVLPDAGAADVLAMRLRREVDALPRGS